MKRAVTKDEIDRFLDYMGVDLLPYQRELLLKAVNHDGPIYFMPARQNGWSTTLMLLQCLAAVYRDN